METHKSLHTASELTWPAVSVYLAFIRHLRRKRVGWLGSVTLKCTLWAAVLPSHLGTELSLTWPIALTDRVEPEGTIRASGDRAASCSITSIFYLQLQLKWGSIGAVFLGKPLLQLHGFLPGLVLLPHHHYHHPSCSICQPGYGLLCPNCGLFFPATIAHLTKSIMVSCPQYRGLLHSPPVFLTSLTLPVPS